MNFSILKSMRATITTFVGDKAMITTEDNQQLSWPSSQLPKDATVGSEVELQILNPHESKTTQNEFAKTVLNEILNVNGKQE